LNKGFISKNIDFENLIIEPLSLEGTAVNRSLAAKSIIQNISETHSIKLEELKASYEGKITFDELFEIAKNDVINYINKEYIN